MELTTTTLSSDLGPKIVQGNNPYSTFTANQITENLPPLEIRNRADYCYWQEYRGYVISRRMEESLCRILGPNGGVPPQEELRHPFTKKQNCKDIIDKYNAGWRLPVRGNDVS
jgi:hypothetical protein